MNNKIQISDNKIRINKFLASAGLGSRRSVEDFIKNKRVKIKQGEKSIEIAKLGDKVDPLKDIIEVDGKVIKNKNKYIYYAVNKPIGYVSTVFDKFAPKVVTELVPKEIKVYPVGRLDKNSRGLIILTNDGELANILTHPKFAHEKEYKVKVKTIMNNLGPAIQKLKKGIKLKEGIAKADKMEILDPDKTGNTNEIKIVLHQGWKRQIRRMCERVGLEILDLKRTRVGKLNLGDLQEGKYNIISKEQIL